MQALVKGLIALAGLIAADLVVKETTGKHIHEHALAWWNELRDRLASWAAENRHLKISKLVASLDGTVQNLARLTVRAHTKLAGEVEVETRQVSQEEAYELFPELRKGPVDLTPMVMAA